MSVSCECCVMSGRGLWDGPITRPVESYRLWCECEAPYREAIIRNQVEAPRENKTIYLMCGVNEWLIQSYPNFEVTYSPVTCCQWLQGFRRKHKNRLLKQHRQVVTIEEMGMTLDWSSESAFGLWLGLLKAWMLCNAIKMHDFCGKNWKMSCIVLLATVWFILLPSYMYCMSVQREIT